MSYTFNGDQRDNLPRRARFRDTRNINLLPVKILYPPLCLLPPVSTFQFNKIEHGFQPLAGHSTVLVFQAECSEREITYPVRPCA
ncbi:hypothetical protein EZS27_005057 [termite gut metagenome]|uniref:Uncharacterized protein n=1 Tax=termite gut metagenome TaxID=433724 RepID=A0A5J4SNZ2_9ZZZZ